MEREMEAVWERASAASPTVVLQVVESLAVGGAERLAVEVANWLRPPLYESHLVCTHGSGPLEKRLSPHVHLFCLHRTSRANLSSFWLFGRYASRAGAHIVHSHGHFTAYFCGLARLLTGGRWLHIFHDHNVLPGQGVLLTAGDRVFLRRLDAHLVVNERLLQRAKRLGLVPRHRCFYVPNGVFSESDLQGTPLGRRAPNSGPPILVQVANVRPVKDQLMAVHAAAVLRSNYGPFRWWLVGSLESDPAYTRRVAEEIHRLGLEDCVQLLGAREDVPSLLRSASVGVLTSRAEGLPLALLEYMGAGLPVVVTDAGHCRTVVEEAKAGFVVPPGDVEGLASRIAWILRHPNEATEMGRRGQELVLARYTIDRTVEAVLRIYDELLSDRRGQHWPSPRQAG
ncbi:MAG: glycosyltransferase family 4 protein [candidate division KSB1 bacterium]|nr:glycosyltransferase family 4 protein [candidate division KSB1 bacterium]